MARALLSAGASMGEGEGTRAAGSWSSPASIRTWPAQKDSSRHCDCQRVKLHAHAVCSLALRMPPPPPRPTSRDSRAHAHAPPHQPASDAILPTDYAAPEAESQKREAKSLDARGGQVSARPQPDPLQSGCLTRSLLPSVCLPPLPPPTPLAAACQAHLPPLPARVAVLAKMIALPAGEAAPPLAPPAPLARLELKRG